MSRATVRSGERSLFWSASVILGCLPATAGANRAVAVPECCAGPTHDASRHGYVPFARATQIPAEEDDLWQRFHRAVNMASAERT
jgi:hypothetical protein